MKDDIIIEQMPIVKEFIRQRKLRISDADSFSVLFGAREAANFQAGSKVELEAAQTVANLALGGLKAMREQVRMKVLTEIEIAEFINNTGKDIWKTGVGMKVRVMVRTLNILEGKCNDYDNLYRQI